MSTCSICLDDFNLGDDIKITNCNHRFHTACLNEWLKTKINSPDCPLCRESLAYMVVCDINSNTDEINQSIGNIGNLYENNGYNYSQGTNLVAIGNSAVAIGVNAGYSGLINSAVAIGVNAGYNNINRNNYILNINRLNEYYRNRLNNEY